MKAIFCPIDMDSWVRAPYFDYYFNKLKTKYNISVNIDITLLLDCKEKYGYKFFPSFLYIIMRAVNQNEEFRMSFDNNNGKLGYWNFTQPSYTIFHEETKTFSDIWSEYTEDFDTFHNNVINDIAKYKNIKEIKGKPNQPLNFCPISCLPWLTFTSVSQDTYGDSTLLFPLIRFGKYFEQNAKTLVPLSISVNHAIADGYHSSKLLNEIQEWTNNCEIWMEAKSKRS